MNILTPKQKIVLQAIKQYFSERGTMPTVRELQEETGRLGLRLKSLRSFFLYLNELERKGYISRSSEHRGISLREISLDSFVNVPVLGSANAGAASVFADEYIEGYIKVSRSIVKDRNVFAIQISGTSMNRAKVNKKTIQDGDFVLIDAANTNYQRIILSWNTNASKQTKNLRSDMSGS